MARREMFQTHTLNHTLPFLPIAKARGFYFSRVALDGEDVELVYWHPTKGEIFTWMRLEDLAPAESERLRLTSELQ